MNYYQARQRQDGRFDFTCMNDGHIHPVGYCHPYRPFVPEQCIWVPEDFRAEYAASENAKQEPFRDRYHADGHATAEEAERCWYEYELDHLRPIRVAGAQYPCTVCQAWTQQGLEAGHGGPVLLCAEHATRDGYAQARPFQAGISITSSW